MLFTEKPTTKYENVFPLDADYRLVKLAAVFCNINKPQFMYELGRLQIPVINLNDDQIADKLCDS